MPALVVCGNRTFVAGDDLRTFTFFAILLRLIQIIVLIPFTVLTFDLYHLNEDLIETCAGDDFPRLINGSYIIFVTYLCSSYVTALVGLSIEIGIWRTGSKGTPTQPEKRACLQPLCHIKLFPMSIFRLGNMFLGIIILKMIRQLCFCGGLYENPYIKCPRLSEFRAYLFILIGSHFAEAAVMSLVAFYFFCKTGNRYPSLISAEAKWRCCCQCCCTVASFLTCCLYGGRDGNTGDFADIAMVLADFFDDDGTLDVVASDIVIGLRMLARVQKQKQEECRDELNRRVSFVAEEMKMSAKMAVESLEIQDEEEESEHERLRQVPCADEEMGGPVVIEEKLAAGEAEDDTLITRDEGTWTGRVSLQDEEMGEVTITGDERMSKPGGEERPSMKYGPTVDALRDEDLNIAEDLAREALLQEEEDEDVPVLKRTGKAKEFPRVRAVVYNLHRTTEGTVHYKPSFREVLSSKNADDKLVIAEGARFMRFSMGVYSFRRFDAQRRSCEVCSAIGEKGRNCIQKGKSCVNQCRDKANEMAGRDFLDFRIGAGYRIGDLLEARFLALAGLDRTQIVYVQFGEGVARTPYCISVDHAWKSVVIVIRGTEGLDDVVADLRMVPVSMEECGARCGFDGSDFYVHSGMLECAKWIYNDLESHGIVDELLSEPRHAGYTLRLTGHSLGAGCAAILSFMIRNKYPSLKCSCFCPPGCTLSESAAESCEDYLTSYVLDHDIVPRTSLGSLDNLRNDMLDMIARLKVTKYQATHAKPDVDKDMLLHRQESIPPSKFVEQLDEFHMRRGEAKSQREIGRIPLYPPGKIVQLVKTTEDQPPPGCCASCREMPGVQEQRDTPYAARYAHVDDFSEIIISSHFLDDHSSPNVLRELERTAEVFGLSSPYTFQEDA